MRKAPKRPPMSTEAVPESVRISEQSINALDTPERILAYCRSSGMINGHETDIEKLIRSTPGLSLKFEEISPHDAYIEKISDDRYDIVINKNHPRTRQRFSMAHEYIHYQIHRPDIEQMPKGERIMHRNDERNRIEYQANRYASMLLMPEDKFRQLALEYAGNVNSIAAAFGVSPLAVRFRARDLGINGHGL